MTFSDWVKTDEGRMRVGQEFVDRLGDEVISTWDELEAFANRQWPVVKDSFGNPVGGNPFKDQCPRVGCAIDAMRVFWSDYRTWWGKQFFVEFLNFDALDPKFAALFPRSGVKFDSTAAVEKFASDHPELFRPVWVEFLLQGGEVPRAHLRGERRRDDQVGVAQVRDVGARPPAPALAQPLRTRAVGRPMSADDRERWPRGKPKISGRGWKLGRSCPDCGQPVRVASAKRLIAGKERARITKRLGQSVPAQNISLGNWFTNNAHS